MTEVQTPITPTDETPDPYDLLPELVIRPARGWAPLNLPDLWRYRELIFFLTWRDISVRYKQTVLGAAWAQLNNQMFSHQIVTPAGGIGGLPDGSTRSEGNPCK